MKAPWQIDDCSEILSPGLVIFRDLVEQNIDRMIEIAGEMSRLRPHCKTHKMAAVIRLQIDRGITKFKCATFPEAEMLAQSGVTDILLAYNMVGPNIPRCPIRGAVSGRVVHSHGGRCHYDRPPQRRHAERERNDRGTDRH